jgi:hypothetical protein
MTITLTEDACKALGVSVGEALYLLAIGSGLDLEEAEKSMRAKGYVKKPSNTLLSLPLRLTTKGKEVITGIIADSTPKDTDARLISLAQELREVFPKGKKDGTNNYWSDGATIIVRRLKLFFKKYGDFTNDQILTAARKYVESFNGNYQFMRTLKYFIFKDARGLEGNIENTSELLTYIENEGQEEVLRDDWTSTTI